MIIPGVLLLLVIFSVASIVLSGDDDRRDRPGELPYWIGLGHH